MNKQELIAQKAAALALLTQVGARKEYLTALMKAVDVAGLHADPKWSSLTIGLSCTTAEFEALDKKLVALQNAIDEPPPIQPE